MKKLSLLIALLAFIFVGSVSNTFGQTTDDKKSDVKKTTITTSKSVVDDKAPCDKKAPKPHNCAHKKPGHKCAGAKKAPCPKTSAVRNDDKKQDEAIMEEKDKLK